MNLKMKVNISPSLITPQTGIRSPSLGFLNKNIFDKDNWADKWNYLIKQ